jgi:hypothetical protein
MGGELSNSYQSSDTFSKINPYKVHHDEIPRELL